jgi:hypothetical protein
MKTGSHINFCNLWPWPKYKSCMAWHEHLWNVGVLQRVHLFNLFCYCMIILLFSISRSQLTETSTLSPPPLPSSPKLLTNVHLLNLSEQHLKYWSASFKPTENTQKGESILSYPSLTNRSAWTNTWMLWSTMVRAKALVHFPYITRKHFIKYYLNSN